MEKMFFLQGMKQKITLCLLRSCEQMKHCLLKQRCGRRQDRVGTGVERRSGMSGEGYGCDGAGSPPPARL